MAVPDTLVGTDSHTTMINGLGVVGWGVGGIEAEAVMLGQPLYMLMPEVVGFELTGELAAGATATDLVLTVTEILRQEGVVGKFVEFFGMAFPRCRWPIAPPSPIWLPSTAPRWASSPSTSTLDYLRMTGRTNDEVKLVERYNKEQGTFRTDDAPSDLHQHVALDLARSNHPWPAPNGPKIACRSRDEAELCGGAAGAGQRARLCAGRSALASTARCENGAVVDDYATEPL